MKASTITPPRTVPLSTVLFACAALPLFAASIAVPNSSFEDPDRTGLPEAYSDGNPIGWVFTSGVNWGVEEIRDDRFGTAGPEGSRLDGLGGNGDQVAYINLGSSGSATATTGTLAQVDADTTYLLTIALGQRASGDRLPDGRIGLWVDGAEVGTFVAYTSADLASGTFTDLQYRWTSPAAGDPLIGGDIQIRLEFEAYDGGGWQQAQFDNVRFEIVPEPSSLLLGSLGLLGFLRRRRA